MGDRKQIKDNVTGIEWQYYPIKEFKEQGLECIIIGEVEADHFPRKGKEVVAITAKQQKQVLLVQSANYYDHSKYKVMGFIETDEADVYIAIVKKKKPIRTIILFLIALVLMLCMFFFWKNNQGPDIDPNLSDYVSNLKRPENLDATQILIPGYNEWRMNDGENVVNATLFNPEDNPCYFQFVIINKNNGDILYESKLVPPGKGIQPITLRQDMLEGVYPIVVRIRTFDVNNHEQEFNGAEVETTIRVVK